MLNKQKKTNIAILMTAGIIGFTVIGSASTTMACRTSWLMGNEEVSMTNVPDFPDYSIHPVLNLPTSEVLATWKDGGVRGASAKDNGWDNTSLPPWPGGRLPSRPNEYALPQKVSISTSGPFRLLPPREDLAGINIETGVKINSAAYVAPQQMERLGTMYRVQLADGGNGKDTPSREICPHYVGKGYDASKNQSLAAVVGKWGIFIGKDGVARTVFRP